MPGVSVFSATHCRAEEVAREAASRLGYQLLEEAALALAARDSGISEVKLARAMKGRPMLSLDPQRERARRIAYLRAAAAEVFSREDVVYHGFAGLLIPQAVTHVLRVCILASPEFRIERLRRSAGVSLSRARKILNRDDLACGEWARSLRNLGPWDKKLWDVRIPMHEHSVEQAAEMVVDAASRDALRPTPESRAAAADFSLAAEVAVALTASGHDVDVSSSGGNVVIQVSRTPLRWERLRRTLAAIAAGVPGVKSTEVRTGPRQSTSFYREEELQLPTRVLLVDDEREFVLALSERLEMRRLEPSVAHDGEEALDLIEKNKPDVMVLDLRMPGMGGMEVLRRLKRDHPEVEVVILTGHGSERDEALAKELGAFAYLQKPVEIDELERTVREADEKARRERASRNEEEAERGAGE